MRRIFFPLKSGVELFEDPSSPEAVTRAKEASVLYDEVIFEDGLYDVAITPQGSTNLWTPPSQMSPERLKQSRRGRTVGEPMTLAMGKQRAAGQPAEEMSVFFQGKISASYVSEYYTGIIQELAKFEPPWARKVTIGGSDSSRELGEAAYAEIKALNFSDFGDGNLMPDTDGFLKSFIYQSFNRDSVLAAGMQASFSVTPMFGPMVSHRGLEPELAGSEALSVLVPNLTSLPWEAVVEYREHPGSFEARNHLREFERLAQEEEPEDAYGFMRKVHQEVNKAYRAAIVDLAPSFPEDLAKEALLTAVSTISVIGAPVEKAASLISTAREARAYNRSWIAALMKLQD